MSVIKVIEIMASSPNRWEDVTIIAVNTARETPKGSNTYMSPVLVFFCCQNIAMF